MAGFITVWPVLSSVFTLRTDYSHFGCTSGWNPILRFSPMWEPTRKTGIGNVLKKRRTEWVFTWQPKSDSQGLKQIWFIGSSCSSFYMGLLLLALLVLLLSGGYYSSPLASTFFLLLLLLFFHYYYFLFITLLFTAIILSPVITFLSLWLLLFFLLLLFFSHYSFSFVVAVTFLTWCCSFPLTK